MPIQPKDKGRPSRGQQQQQTIQRTTLRNILCGNDQLVIPMFQRTYCWSQDQIDRWWFDLLDVIQGVSSGSPTDQGLAFRNINTMRLKRLVVATAAATSDLARRPVQLVVDGQQRLTTTSLLLAACWHAGRRLLLKQRAEGEVEENHDDGEWLAAETAIRQALFFLADNDDEASSEQLKLVPALADRAAYRLAVSTATDNVLPGGGSAAPLLAARHRFDALLRCHLNNGDFERTAGALARVGRIVSGSLDLMRPMLVELEGPAANLPTLFQHYQEQSLLGVAALLRGVPGVSFRPLDLVRNYVMADYVHLPLEEQEDIYQELWLQGLENRAPQQNDLDKALDRFLCSVGFPPWWLPEAAGTSPSSGDGGRFVSDFEARVRRIREQRTLMAQDDAELEEDEEKEKTTTRMNGIRGNCADLDAIELYARFCSYIENLKKTGAQKTRTSAVPIFLEKFSKFLIQET